MTRSDGINTIKKMLCDPQVPDIYAGVLNMAKEEMECMQKIEALIHDSVLGAEELMERVRAMV